LIDIVHGDVMFTGIIADLCLDTECGGCCSSGAGDKPYFIDIEYYTLLYYFGGLDYVDGSI